MYAYNMYTYLHTLQICVCVCHWKFPSVTQQVITHKDWSWISSLDPCLQSRWLFAAWSLNLVVGLKTLLQVAALFLMADCHTGLSSVTHSSPEPCHGVEIRSFYKYFSSPQCLSLVCFNKLIRCQLLTDPTIPERVASVKGP